MIRVTSDRSGAVWTPSASGAACGREAELVFVSRLVRLDNRDQLVDILEIGRASSVDAILLNGWSRWREGLPEKLKGQFAFAIFDNQNETLFIARDTFGEAPLFYFVGADRIVVADASRTVRELAGCDLQPNLQACADFLNGGYGTQDSTFFDGLSRLPAGCWTKFHGTFSSPITRYWSPAQFGKDREMACNPADQVAAFRDAFDRSVMARYQPGSTAILLSGGLDSSAILGSLIAQGVAPRDISCLIKTYRKSRDWRDERSLASLQRHFGLAFHEIASDRHDPLQDMETWLEVLDGPYVSYGHSVASNLLFEAKRVGWHSLYSGHGGDEVVGYGMGRINELARQGRWFEVWRETKGMALLGGQSRVRIMRKYLTHNPGYRRLERHLLRVFPDAQQDPNVSLNDHAAALLGEFGTAKASSILRSDHDDLMLQIEALEDPVQQLALETINQSGRSLGITTQMPFYDRDLVELSLSLPSSLKLQDGMSRYVLRAAMSGRLPDDVLSRQDKFDFTDPFVAGLVAHKERILDLTQQGEGGLLTDLAHAGRLKRVRDQLARTGTGLVPEDAHFIWRCSVLAIWQGQLKTSSGLSVQDASAGQP